MHRTRIESLWGRRRSGSTVWGRKTSGGEGQDTRGDCWRICVHLNPERERRDKWPTLAETTSVSTAPSLSSAVGEGGDSVLHPRVNYQLLQLTRAGWIWLNQNQQNKCDPSKCKVSAHTGCVCDCGTSGACLNKAKCGSWLEQEMHGAVISGLYGGGGEWGVLIQRPRGPAVVSWLHPLWSTVLRQWVAPMATFYISYCNRERTSKARRI